MKEEIFEFSYTGLFFDGEPALINKDTGAFFTMQLIEDKEWIKQYIKHPIMGSSINRNTKMKGVIKPKDPAFWDDTLETVIEDEGKYN